MELIKEYLISVTAAALICGAISSLTSKNASISKLMQLLCGLFLAITVIKPIVEVKLDNIDSFTDLLVVDGEIAASTGKEMAAEEMKRIIKERTEAYILDKAKSLGTEIEVEVILEDLTPAGAIITGSVSPFARSSLSTSISQDLGIPPEGQIWNRS